MALRLEERDLVIAYQRGDDEAFAELVREYRPQLLGHARRRLQCPDAAEDAVQEALTRALRAMPRFNGNYRVGPWLHRILANVCSDEGNRRRRDSDKIERCRSNDLALTSPPTTEGELGLDLDHTELRDAVDGLSEQYREALMLRFVEELSYEEVAQAAGISEDNARARVSRARTAVRAALKLAAAAPIALIGLLRRGERAASALGASTAEAGRAAANSAAPLLADTAPLASRAAVAGSAAVGTAAGSAALGTGVAGSAAAGSVAAGAAAAGTAAAGSVAVGTAATGAAVAGVPMIAKAAVGLGLATAVVAPTIDSPVHRAAERVLPGAVVEAITPFAIDVPTPDTPVAVPMRDVPAVAPVPDAASAAAPASAAERTAALLAVVAASRETGAHVERGDTSAGAVSSAADASGRAAVAPAALSSRSADAAAADSSIALTGRLLAESTTARAAQGVAPTVASVTSGSVDGGELTFTAAGAGRYDVAGALVLTVTTTVTVAEAADADGQPGATTVTTSTTDEPLSLLAPSSAALSPADPADPTAQQRFGALLVIDAGNGDTVEMRLAARGTASGSSLPLEGLFTATQSDALPLAQRGSMVGALTLDDNGEPQSLSLTLGP